MFTNYLKVSLRNILRHKGYSIINIAGLAVGLTSCLLILLWVQDELSFDRFNKNAKQIYFVTLDQRYSGGRRVLTTCTPAPLGTVIKEAFPEISNAARFNPFAEEFLVRYGYKAFNEEVNMADNSLFEIFSFPMIAGSAENPLSEPGTVVLAAETAKKLFGAVQAGRAVDDPVKAMKTASQIADLWAERYMPGSSLPAKKMRVGNGIPFQNKAWVRASVPQQEGNNMNRASAAAALAAAAVMMGAGKAEAVSDPVSVNFSPHQNRYWTTVLTNEVPLRWNWNAAATHAELDIRGMNASFTTNFTGITSNYLWRTFAGSVPEREDAYTLTLRFYNGNDVLVGAMTSKLAVVTGAFGKAVVDPGPAEKNWARIRDNVVIPYDSTWAAATADAANGRIVIAKIGGTSQTNAFADASSYYGLKLKHGDWEYGAFFLALTFPGHEGEWNANVVYVPNGTLIRVK